jgi:hypothetical protein
VVRVLLDPPAMPDRDPECEALLEQTQESLRAMKLHIVNYQLHMLLLSLRNPVVNSDSAHANGNGNGTDVTSRSFPERKSRH